MKSQELFTFNVENPETAYILGYLWSDGSVFYDKHKQAHIRLFINESDGENIKEYFNNFSFLKKWTSYRYHYPSATRNNGPKIQFTLYNQLLGKFLLEILNYKNKSLASPIEISKFIPLELLRYFWLGIFDGDGCICEHNSKFRWTITSSYDQNWDSYLIWLKSIGISTVYTRRVITKTNQFSFIDISNLKDMSILYDYWYKDNLTIGLKRKRDKMLHAKEHYLNTVNKQSSKHRGVSYNARNKKWKGYIRKNKKTIHLGYFPTEQKALEKVLSYDRK